MIFQKQLFRHNPTENVFGDCDRATIACLLNRPVESVYHWGQHWNDIDLYNRTKQQELKNLGHQLVTFAFNAADVTLQQVLNTQYHQNPGIFYRLAGESRNGCAHLVIGCNNKIIWDTSLDDSGIIGPDLGYYYIEYLVPLLMLDSENKHV